MMNNPILVRDALAEMPNSLRFPPNPSLVVPRSIEVLAFASVQLLDVSGPLQVFATANELALKAGGAAPYAPRVVTRGGQHVAASAGLVLAASPFRLSGRLWIRC